MHGQALAGAGNSLSGGRWKRNREGGLGLLRGPRILKSRNFHHFFRNSQLDAVLAALELPSLLKNLLERFLAVRNGDPRVAVALWTSEPNGKASRHERPLRNSIIPADGEVGGAPCRLAVVEK
jgi:hypothetical protein